MRAVQQEAAWSQRIVINGSDNHDGDWQMSVGTEIEHVAGENIDIQSQALKPGIGWINSNQREVAEWVDSVGLTITIFADDSSAQPDGDFNDLIVVCVPEEADLISPQAGVDRPDLSIPEQWVNFDSDHNL